jgi:autotransporter-associated beta strand protein
MDGIDGGRGGSIIFVASPPINTARVELFGNGTLTLYTATQIGSIEGDGIVTMGRFFNLTVGNNSLSTTFSGTLEGDSGSSLIKVGTGTLTLSGANTYISGTTVLDGSLKLNNTAGSGTGTGPVLVQAGTLSGKGIIGGAVTVGTGSGVGAFLAPGKGASQPNTLTLQSALTFKADSSYTYKLNTKKAKSDQVIANGLTIESGAQFDLTRVGNTQLTIGRIFTAISNTSATPIAGTFANLADGSILTVGVNKLRVSYSGGDGNDLTLTVVP